MYRQPTGIKVGALETDDPESSDYIQRDINVLSYASKAAFIDIARDGKEGTLENDAPGDIALTVRIDYPGIVTSDLLRGCRRFRFRNRRFDRNRKYCLCC